MGRIGRMGLMRASGGSWYLVDGVSQAEVGGVSGLFRAIPG